ncbi:hypothetical protein SERLA73DRAFT_184050 [Serpula lacrymans var. lacrymans S7.3]|uniref:Uncharacterized protein n=2 Tax=Serpula lacrymans var. lacrymans TaxID=341189 RepID=F8Q2F5_SERL3|nr:uncharacterized protein SERLADRAFT_471525 [Serpula lacrymans var. lacrymans S7.9]EGN97366.1 hypothetical protein SERLA73DRAFT_184050 [Serpula lacrymans var. lacrymans S7.3]EGO22959.1 hypothetical protein SERLADRAFT_471525 [Serpula lacrymans var. lacrymans S7.9]
MEAQILYLHVKLQTAKSKMINVNPVAFAFDGEYSTVIGNKSDIQGEQKGSEARTVNMRQDACNIVRELSEALGTVFNPMGSFPNEFGGIIMRFSCVVVVNVPLPFAQSKPNDTLHDPDAAKDAEQNDDSDVFVKRMVGELEVTVHPDNTHKLFVGQRYVIQFRLIG